MPNLEEQKIYDEFRSKMVNVGDLIDESISVIAEMVDKKALSPIDMLSIPVVITMAVRKAIGEENDELKED